MALFRPEENFRLAESRIKKEGMKQPTVVRVVHVDDVLPAVERDHVENGLVVLGSQAQRVVHEAGRRDGHLFFFRNFQTINTAARECLVYELDRALDLWYYLFREPRTKEGHVVRVGVRVDGAERVGAHGAHQSENPARQLRANWSDTKKRK